MNETSASTSSCSRHAEITLLISIILLLTNPNITIVTLRQRLSAVPQQTGVDLLKVKSPSASTGS